MRRLSSVSTLSTCPPEHYSLRAQCISLRTNQINISRSLKQTSAPDSHAQRRITAKIQRLTEHIVCWTSEQNANRPCVTCTAWEPGYKVREGISQRNRVFLDMAVHSPHICSISKCYWQLHMHTFQLSTSGTALLLAAGEQKCPEISDHMEITTLTGALEALQR